MYDGDDADSLFGGSVNDSLNGCNGNNNLFGHPNDDCLLGSLGIDFFDCGLRKDKILDF
jgi:serralysin